MNTLLKRFDEIERELTLIEKRINADDISEDLRDNLRKSALLLRQLEIENLFTGKYDKGPAIISVSAGAGGQDAEDWAGMLYEMYAKFAEKRGWKTKVIHESFGDFQSKTGRHLIKDITLEIFAKGGGGYIYGYLKKKPAFIAW